MDEKVTNPEAILEALGAEMPAGDGEKVEEEKPKFVHEPTGKEFDNEVEFLKYDAGWKNNEWGKRVSELEQKLEQIAKTPKKEEEAPAPKSKKEIKKMLWPDRPDETLDDPFTDFLLEGLDSALTLNNQQLVGQISQLQETVAALQSRLEETSARTELGVDGSVEQKILEKHPYLKALSPRERVAVIADMAKAEGKAETPKPKSKQVPQQRAEDHVEGSALSAPAEEADAGFESWLKNDFRKLGVNDQLSAFSTLVAKARKDGAIPS